jgi:hypothetical protein
VDFRFSFRTEDLRQCLLDFLTKEVPRAEPLFAEQVAASATTPPPVMEDLKGAARERRFWNPLPSKVSQKATTAAFKLSCRITRGARPARQSVLVGAQETELLLVQQPRWTSRRARTS